MATTQEQLKALNVQKKQINERTKALHAEFNKGKDQRIKSGKEKAAARKLVGKAKSELRTLGSEVYHHFSEGDVDTIRELANDIENASKSYVDAIRSFADAEDSLEEL